MNCHTDEVEALRAQVAELQAQELMSDVVELRRVEPRRNCFRRYRVSESRTLFGEPCLVIEWGRLGGRQRVRLETFAGRSGLARRREELLSRRRQHGYVSVSR